MKPDCTHSVSPRNKALGVSPVALLALAVSFGFASLAWAGTDGPVASSSLQDPVARAVALLATDRSAALSELRAIWGRTGDPHGGAAAVALADALGDGAQWEELSTLAGSMLASEVLSPAQAALVFEARLRAVAALRQWPEDDAALAAEAAARSAVVPPGDARAAPWLAIGAARTRLGRFADAEAAFRQALGGFEGAAATVELSETQSSLGVALAQQGKMDQALESFLAAQATREQLGLADSSKLLSNLAGLYIYLERWDRALEFAERAIASSEPLSSDRARATNNSGTALFGLGRLEEASARFEQALALHERLGQPSLSPLNNLAFALLKQGQTREALRRFEQVEAIAIEAKDSALLGPATKNIGETWIALGDRVKADRYLERAAAIYAENDNRPKRLELYPILIDNLEALGRHREALARMREFKALSEEMTTVASNERIAALEARAELAAKESQLAVQQADLDRLRAQEATERLERRGLLVAVGALALILLLAIRNIVYKARANRELTTKNREIEAQRASLEQLHDTVRRQSEEDALTGLHNRRYLKDLVAHAGTQTDVPLLAIVADLDHFKSVNDEFGHTIGDRVLQHVATVLRGCQREGDELIRWGGEEFIWLCRGASEIQGPDLCARLQRALAEHPIELDGRMLQLTASLGFAPAAVWRDRRPSVDLAIRLADHSAYRAKEAGRNSWSGYRSGSETPPAGVDLDRCPIETMEKERWIEPLTLQ